MGKFFVRSLLLPILAVLACGQFTAAQTSNTPPPTVPAPQVIPLQQSAPSQQLSPGFAPTSTINTSDASKWILLRNMQVIQAKTRLSGDKTALIMEQGSELTVSSTDILFQADSIDDVAKFRLAGVDPNNVQSQVEFVEWAIRYEVNGLAKLQLNQLIAKYPQSQKLQLLARRIESNELMKQQQAIAVTMPAPTVAKTAFVAPVKKVDAKANLSRKQNIAKNNGRGVYNSENQIVANRAIDPAPTPKTLPSIATPNPIANAPAEIAKKSNRIGPDPQIAQQKPRATMLAPENSSDPFDPEVFNRMHAKQEKGDSPQETTVPVETGPIFRR